MSTNDMTDISSPCVCGRGTIVVTQSMPDHPWVTASQISYSGSLNCDHCEQIYVIRQSNTNSYPTLYKLADVQAFNAAEAARTIASDQVSASPQAALLKTRIVSVVEAEPTQAAAYRLLSRMKLCHESLGTYRKHRRPVADYVRYVSGSTLADIGKDPEFGQGDWPYFKKASDNLEALRAAERSIRLTPVTTGAHWLSH